MPEEKRKVSLDDDYDFQLALAEKVYRFGLEITSGKMRLPEGDFSRKHYVFFGLVDKSLTTFKAIITLTRAGLVDDSYSLLRTLVESIINAGYIVFAGDDQRANDYADYPSYKDWLNLCEMEALSPELKGGISDELQEKKRQAYERAKARFDKNRNRDWTPDSLFKRAKDVDEKIGKDNYEMRFLVNGPWREACSFTHGSADSIASRFVSNEEGVQIHRVVTKKEMAHVLNKSIYTVMVQLAEIDLLLGMKNVDKYLALQREWIGKEAGEEHAGWPGQQP